MALQDRVLLVVHPDRDLDDDNGWLFGFAKLSSAPRAHPHRIRRSRPSGRAGRSWRRGDFLLPWLLHITLYELCQRPCCAPFPVPRPGS